MKKITALIMAAFVLCSFAFAADTLRDSWVKESIASVVSSFPKFKTEQPEIYASFERASGIIYDLYYTQPPDESRPPISLYSDLQSRIDRVIIDGVVMPLREDEAWEIQTSKVDPATSKSYLDVEIYIFDPAPFYKWSTVDNKWDLVNEVPLFLANPVDFENDMYVPKLSEKQKDPKTGKDYINKYTLKLPLGTKIETGITLDYDFHLFYVDQGRPSLRWPSEDSQLMRVTGK